MEFLVNFENISFIHTSLNLIEGFLYLKINPTYFINYQNLYYYILFISA